MTTKNHTDVGKTKVPKELQKFAGPPRAFDRQAWTADSICLGLAGYLFENQFGHCGSAETGIVFALAKRNRTSPHTHTRKSNIALRFGWMVLGHITQLGVASPGFADGFHLCAMVKLSQCFMRFMEHLCCFLSEKWTDFEGLTWPSWLQQTLLAL